MRIKKVTPRGNELPQESRGKATSFGQVCAIDGAVKNSAQSIDSYLQRLQWAFDHSSELTLSEREAIETAISNIQAARQSTEAKPS